MSARARSLLVALGALAVLAVAALGLVLGARPLGPDEPVVRATEPPLTSTPAPTTPTPDPTEEPGPLADLHVVLDPGHNGGNAAAPAEINALVGDGRGGSKACNTVGSSTTSGYPEHAFTFDVAQRAREILVADGATVTLTREDDTGVGPCVDERGQAAQTAGADVLVSIHADGAADPAVRGYFAIVSEPPLNDAQAEPSRALAADLLAALGAAGFAPSSSYPGALSERADLGTLNWAERPAVLLELAEMRNPGEAALIESEEGRRRYAEAVAAGIREWAAGS
ncbi:N-acetylmuramoyl-L-alanine amidase [Georgenia sp. M64]|uniref:N-acetylmuramoyl-L-alanine amidase n=1 Tax=Georgenia sp. M64 TaxID=3120520 RepID=UPI0030E39F4D